MKEKPGKLIAQRICNRRRQLGMTQEKLSDLTGLRQSAISQIERGVHDDIEVGTLIPIAKSLGVSLDYLAGLTGPDITENLSLPPIQRGRPTKATVSRQ